MKAWDTVRNFFMPEINEEDVLEKTYIEEIGGKLKQESLAERKKRAEASLAEVEEVTLATGTTGSVEYSTAVKNSNAATSTAATATNSASVAVNRLKQNTANPFVVRPQAIKKQKADDKVKAKTQFKQQNMDINIHSPRMFDDVRMIADNIRAGKVAVVNYENLDIEMQRRICDFMNGVCYVLDGSVRRISLDMVLYVPTGINIGDIMDVDFVRP